MRRLVALVAFPLAMTGCGGGDDENGSAAKWLDLEIDRPEIEYVFEEPPAIAETEDGDELITNAYFVPPSILTSAPRAASTSGDVPDPLAGPAQQEPVVIPSAKEVLERYGVVFGPGAWAKYRREDSSLIVCQTRVQMAIVEAIITPIGQPYDFTATNVRVEIYEVTSGDALKLEKSAGEHFENTPELDAVRDLVRNGAARIVAVMGMKCRSGQRSRSESAIEYRYLAGIDWKGEGENRILKPVFKSRMVGTLLEVDTVTGPTDVLDVHLTLEHHTAPPKMERRKMAIPGVGQEAGPLEFPVFFFHKIDTTETMLSGSAKLLGSWSLAGVDGTGSDEVRQIAFLRTDLQAMMGMDLPSFRTPGVRQKNQ